MITFSVYTSSLRLHGIKFARNIFKGFTWDPTDVFIFQAPPSEFIEGYCTYTRTALPLIRERPAQRLLAVRAKRAWENSHQRPPEALHRPALAQLAVCYVCSQQAVQQTAVYISPAQSRLKLPSSSYVSCIETQGVCVRVFVFLFYGLAMAIIRFDNDPLPLFSFYCSS
jgi:hypothetical protein